LFPRAFGRYKARTRAPPLHLELSQRFNFSRASATLGRYCRARASPIPLLHWHCKFVSSFALALRGHRAATSPFSRLFSLTNHHRTLAVRSRPPSRALRCSRTVFATLFYAGEFTSSFSFEWY
jgi:hypothetical protein